MNIDHKDILAVYRRTNEEMTYQMVCMRLAIESLEKRNRELEAEVTALREPTTDTDQ
jgi:hypothetical protein